MEEIGNQPDFGYQEKSIQSSFKKKCTLIKYNDSVIFIFPHLKISPIVVKAMQAEKWKKIKQILREVVELNSHERKIILIL